MKNHSYGLKLRNRFPYRSLACSVVRRAIKDAQGTKISAHETTPEPSIDELRFWLEIAEGVAPGRVDESIRDILAQ